LRRHGHGWSGSQAIGYLGDPMNDAVPDATAITALLKSWRAGTADAGRGLEAQVYAQLKQMARQRFRGGDAVLSPTVLVHEAVAQMLDASVDWNSRAHFFALAALQMRTVLVDHARRAATAKRGSDPIAVTLDPAHAAADDGLGVLEVHDALEKLAAEDARSARALELTYFGGLDAKQVGEVLGISVATVERDLKFGRAWLREAMA
jgi:RNA polymerase sigma factor (TIGR02999 family)